MTTTQFLILVGTVWIAPHVPKYTGMYSGLVMLVSASVVGIMEAIA